VVRAARILSDADDGFASVHPAAMLRFPSHKLVATAKRLQAPPHIGDARLTVGRAVGGVLRGVISTALGRGALRPFFPSELRVARVRHAARLAFPRKAVRFGGVSGAPFGRRLGLTRLLGSDASHQEK